MATSSINKGKLSMNNVNDKEYAGLYEIHRVGDTRLYFEHIEHGEGRACCIELDENGDVYDYDMCSTIPNAVGQWLLKNGYNVEYRKDKYGAYWDYV